MYQVSDRTMRRYRELLSKKTSFLINLKSNGDIINVQIKGGNAMLLNDEKTEYDRVICSGEELLRRIKNNEPIEQKVEKATVTDSTKAVLKAISESEEVIKATSESEKAKEAGGVSSDGGRTPSDARRIIAAIKAGIEAGSEELRIGKDILRLHEENLVWEFVVGRRVVNLHAGDDVELVAKFYAATSCVEFSAESKHRAVVERRALVHREFGADASEKDGLITLSL